MRLRTDYAVSERQDDSAFSLRVGDIATQVPERFSFWLGASVGCGGAHQKGFEIPTYFERLARVRNWVAGISVFVLAASGIVAIVPTIRASHAGIPGGEAPATRRTTRHTSDEAHIPQTQVTPPSLGFARRNSTRCPECGVIESIRPVEQSSAVVEHDSVDAKFTRDGIAQAISANARPAKLYEITVRFRDGSTTVFSQADARRWLPGSRVTVIGPSPASNN